MSDFDAKIKKMMNIFFLIVILSTLGMCTWYIKNEFDNRCWGPCPPIVKAAYSQALWKNSFPVEGTEIFSNLNILILEKNYKAYSNPGTELEINSTCKRPTDGGYKYNIQCGPGKRCVLKDNIARCVNISKSTEVCDTPNTECEIDSVCMDIGLKKGKICVLTDHDNMIKNCKNHGGEWNGKYNLCILTY